jgi:transposase
MPIIGIDTHSATCTFGVISEDGTVMESRTVSTSVKNLWSVICSIPCPRVVVVEENHLAAWVKVNLEPVADKVVVSEPRENRTISKAEFMDDRRSALELAQLYRQKRIKEVYHSPGVQADLRAMFMAYYDWMHQVARFKIKLIALFHGVAAALPAGMFELPARAETLKALKLHPIRLAQAQRLLMMIESAEHCKDLALKQMVKAARDLPAFKILDEMPGCGDMITCGYLGLIQTPHRFARENDLWRYAGFGIRHKESGGKAAPDRCSNSGNKPLKWVVLQHFTYAVQRGNKSNRFRRAFEDACARGLEQSAARRHTCRKILSTVKAIWSKGRRYDDSL